ERTCERRVDSIACFPGDDLFRVDDTHGRTDDAVVLRVLEGDVVRWRQRGGISGKLAVAERPPVRVDDRTRPRRDPRRFDLPARRRSLHEEPARLRTDLAVVGPGFRDARAATRPLRAVLPGDAGFLAARLEPERKLLDAHA